MKVSQRFRVDEHTRRRNLDRLESGETVEFERQGGRVWYMDEWTYRSRMNEDLHSPVTKNTNNDQRTWIFNEIVKFYWNEATSSHPGNCMSSSGTVSRLYEPEKSLKALSSRSLIPSNMLNNIRENRPTHPDAKDKETRKQLRTSWRRWVTHVSTSPDITIYDASRACC